MGGAKPIEAVVGEVFDPEIIENRIRAMSPKSEEVVYSGLVARCDVDLYNSSGLVKLLERYGYSGSFFTPILKREARNIVEKNKGYWIGTKGDSAEYMFGDLENAIRCTAEIVWWVDRELTEYVKDHVVAREILKEEGKLKEVPRKDNKAIECEIKLIRKIKDKWGGDVPKRHRKLKEFYEKKYAKIDGEVAQISGEPRGRIVTKSGITFDNVELNVTKTPAKNGIVEVNRDPQGAATYLMSRLTDKAGPLGGKKDIILFASYNKIKNLPKNITFQDLGKTAIHGMVYRLYQTWSVDNYNHPTFDGRIPEESSIIQKLESYKKEINKQVCFLKKLQKKKRDASLPWLNVTSDGKENIDYYKNGRSLMTTTFVLAIMDEVTKIYKEELKKKTNKKAQAEEVFDLLGDVYKDATLTGFIDTLEKARKNMIIAALVYSNGGTLSRAQSDTPKYATRKLKPEDNLSRIVNERKGVYYSTSDYSELVKLGIPELLNVQDKNISEIRDHNGYELAMKAMILKMASRYVHHRSYRSWKLPAETAEDAIFKIREELYYLINPNGKGYFDRNFELIDWALTNALGIKRERIPFTKKS